MVRANRGANLPMDDHWANGYIMIICMLHRPRNYCFFSRLAANIKQFYILREGSTTGDIGWETFECWMGIHRIDVGFLGLLAVPVQLFNFTTGARCGWVRNRMGYQLEQKVKPIELPEAYPKLTLSPNSMAGARRKCQCLGLQDGSEGSGVSVMDTD